MSTGDPERRAGSGLRARLGARPLLAPLLVHAALFAWAAWAWIGGPFEGRGVVDGAEVLALATTGSAGPFETKSPLYPWLLGRLLRLGGDPAWTVALLGGVLSLGLVAAIFALARRVAGPRSAPPAAWLYALSGSPLAFGVQPLETLLGALLLALGALAVEARWARGAALIGGLLLGAAPLARADLALPALALLALALRRRSPAALAAPAAFLFLVASFGERSFPEGGALNLRLGNDPARPGFTDLRVGPAYDRLRLEAVFEQPSDRPLEPTGTWHLALLGRAIAADPAGFAANLLRKLYLSLHRTEIVASADFRHGLASFPPAPLLLQSFALIAPLAWIGLRRRAPPVLVLPLAALLVGNVLLVAAARYRFPALPFLCVAASLCAQGRPTRREVIGFAGLLLVLVPNLSGRRLVTPGDGLVQEGYLLLAQEPGSPRAREVLQRAVEVGEDPRARYLLGLACEQGGLAGAAAGAPKGAPFDGALLDEAERWYAAALDLEPAYPEAAENRVSLALRRGQPERARALGRDLLGVPYAGMVHLNLAELLAPGDPERRRLARQGHERMALRSHAQGSPAALAHAREALRLGSGDARVRGLVEAAARERR